MNYSTDPLIYELRSGKEGDEFVERTINQKIINRKVLLPELPDPNRKVEISGYFELPNESDEIGPNHFSVDYQTGDVFFHPEQEGKSIKAHFFGRGLVYIPASRVYTRTQNGNVTETLEKIVEKGEEAVEALKKIDTTIQLAEDATEEAIQSANASNLAAKHATDMGNFASTKGQEAELAAQHADSARLSAERSEQIRITAESERNTKEMVRQQQETSRETKETQRQDKEAGRLIAETERQTAETARASAEALRRSEEDKRKLNETTRQSSETTRNNAESSRQQAEGLRATEESKRQQNETKRGSYEAARVLSENDRGSRESSRHDAEQIRLLAETERVNEEKKRISAEAGRGTAETGRQTAETNRASAETMRLGSEKTRVDNEKQRMLDEKSRSESEATRMGSEQERGINETDRNSAELVRKTSEAARIAAEQQRNNNEAARQINMDNALTDVNHAIQNAEEIVENTKGVGEYDSETTYHPNNIVTYNGSSFMALDEVAGVTPSTSSSKWQLVAQRGIDGAGSVVTVNGKSPDLDGNVLLTVNEVQGAVTAQQLAQVNSSKVDKIAGKNLSTEDYTTADKNKLGGIASGANNYTHPVSDGNLHVPATGTASNGKFLKAGSTAGSASWSTITRSDISDFPASLPANGGDADTVDGLHASTGSTANTVAARQGNGNLQAAALISTVAEGTAPFQVVSSTKVNALNADLLDGYHANIANANNTVVVRGSTGNISVQAVLSKIGTVAGGAVHYALQNGDLNRFGMGLGGVESGSDSGSQFQIFSYNDAGAWVRTVLAIDRVTGDAAFSNNVSAARLISRIGTGTAPFVVSSTTVVSNLNADLLDGLHSTDFLRNTQSIGTGADLNNYSTAGMYSCSANVTAASLLNCPTQYAFSLLVEKHAGTKQTLTEYFNTADAKTWTRNNYGGVWGSWYKVWDARQMGTGSGLDADMLNGKQASEFVDIVDYVRSPGYVGTSGRSATAYVVNLSPAPVALVDGMAFSFKTKLASLDGIGIDLNSLGVKPIKTIKDLPIKAGQIAGGAIVTVRYNANIGAFILQGEGGEYGTAIASDVRKGKTIGTDDGLVTGTATIINPPGIEWEEVLKPSITLSNWMLRVVDNTLIIGEYGPGAVSQLAISPDYGDTWITAELGGSYSLGGSFFRTRSGTLINFGSSILRSADGGKTWTAAAIPSSMNPPQVAAQHPITGRIVATSGSGSSSIAYTCYSDDDGITWIRTTGTAFNTGAVRIVATPQRFLRWGSGTNSSYYSTNGESWTPIPEFNTRDIRNIYVYGSYALAIYANSGLVMISSDGGASWSSQSIPSISMFSSMIYVNSVQRGSKIYVSAIVGSGYGMLVYDIVTQSVVRVSPIPTVAGFTQTNLRTIEGPGGSIIYTNGNDSTFDTSPTGFLTFDEGLTWHTLSYNSLRIHVNSLACGPYLFSSGRGNSTASISRTRIQM